MSGSTIGGVVGAAIGFMVGGPAGAQWGWMLGSVAGGVLMPPEAEGPRLADLRPQSSEYGRPIPIVIGTGAVSGNVIWQSDLVAVPTEEGGKGSGGVTTYKYYANFALLLCEGTKTLGRIWEGPEKRLVYDGTRLEGGGTLTFYSGTDTQEPDPLMESHLGVGNVPAYKGYAYVVVSNYPVENAGNALPFWTVEVGSVETTSASLGTVWPVGPVLINEAQQTFSFTYSGTNGGVITRSLVDQSFVSNYEWEGYKGSTHSFLDPVRNVALYLDVGALTWLDLTDGSTGTVNTWPGLVGSDWAPVGGVYHNDTYCFLMHKTSGNGVAISVLDPDSLSTTPASLAFYEGDAGFETAGLVLGFCDHFDDASNYILGVTKAGTVRKYPLTAGFTSTSCGACVDSATLAVDAAKDPSTGFVWTATFSSGTLTVACNDPVTEAQLYSDVLVTEASDCAGGTRRATPWVFNGDDGRVLYLAEKWVGTDYFIEFNATAPAHIQNITGVYRGTGDINVGWYNPVDGKYWFVRDHGWANSTQSPTNDLATVAVWDYDGEEVGYEMGEVGMTQSGTLLSDAITELCARADLTAIDVSDLTTDLVHGYVIAQQTTVRGAIQVLQPAYYFDVADFGDVVRFVKRGGASVVTIPDDDLGAFESGGTPDMDLMLTTRRMEDELPRVLTVNYISRASNYENATKQARRLVSGSGDEQTLDLPIVMDDTMGQEVAETNLHKAWVGRMTYQFTLPLHKYQYLGATDVITVRGDKRMMLTSVTESGALLKCEGVFDDFNYTPHVVVTESPQSGSDTVFQPSPTYVHLMNLVALRSQDTDAGFYAAACGTVEDRWRGAVLYQSKDDGNTYRKVGTFANPATMGSTTDILDNYTGGSAIDTVSTVNVRLEYGELSSTNDTGFQAGTNAAAIGEEIVYFRDATLEADGTYTLSHLLRGRAGSGTEISSHAAGEPFVLLSSATVIRVTAQPSDIGVPYLYRAVSVGSTLAETEAFEFTITGVSYNPAAPVDVAQPATLFGYDAVNSSGLTWAYYGGAKRKADGTIVLISAGTVTLTDNATNYIYATDAGVVTVTTVEPAGWPAPLADDAVALYEVVVAGGVVQSYVDYRTAGGGSSAALPTQPFDLFAFCSGIPAASAIITRVPVARAITFPAGLTGSWGTATVAATGQTDFDIKKTSGGTTTSVGTIRFAAAATTASFIAASAITLAAGDVISIHAPASADATLANPGFVLAGTR